MSSSESKSGIGTKLTVAVLGMLLIGAVVSTAIIGAAAAGVIGDTEPVGDNNITTSTTTATTDVAWVDATTYTSNNTTQTTLYDENGDKIWVTNLNDKYPDDFRVERLQGETRPIQNMEWLNNIATDDKYVYVSVNFDNDEAGPKSIVYKLNQSTGNIVDEIGRNTSTSIIRVDKSGNLRYDEFQRTYSLSKDTRYNLLDDGTIEVYNTSNTTGDGTLEKTINASYDSEIQGTGSQNTVLESTDGYVVVWVQVGTRHDLHIVNRDTGQSEYEIEGVDGGDKGIQYDNTSRIVASPDGEIKLEVYTAQNSPNTHYFVRFDYENGTVVENQSGEVESYFNDDGEVDTRSPVEVDFFRNGFAEDVTFVPLGELSLSVSDVNGSAINSTATVKIFNDNGHQIFERSDINGTEIQSNYIIDAYAGDYSVRVEADGYDGTVYSASIDEREQTALLNYTLQEAIGTLKIDSVTNDSGTGVSNWSVEVYDSNDSLIHSESNLSAPYNTSLPANQTYTVAVLADGYNTTNETVSITDDTTSTTSFTLSSSGDSSDGGDSTDNTTDDGDSTDNTTSTDDSDDGVFVGGDAGSGLIAQLGGLLAAVIGFIAFPFSLTILFFVLLWLRRRRDGGGGNGGLFGPNFALMLIGLVLISGVAPYMVGPASAQTDTPEYETADLLVFTAAENKSQVAQETQDKVVALNPNTSEVAWETRLNDSTNGNIVYSVAWDKSQHRIYATSMEEDGSIHLYELEDATGEVEDVHHLNLTPDAIGKDSIARDGTLYFTTDAGRYTYDFETENLTSTNSYTPPAEGYAIGFSDGQAAISTYGSDYITTYLGDTEQYQAYTTQNISSIQHTEIGFLYQDENNISLRNTLDRDVVWSDSTARTLRLHGATSNGQDTIYARVGASLYSYERDSGNQTVLYDGSIPDNTTAGFAEVDYKSGRIHTYQTVGGQDLANDTPTHLYHIHNASTGELLYSEEIVYDSNQHQSVAIVYEQTDTVEVIVGSGGSDYSPEDVFGELVGQQLMLIVGVFGSTLLGLIVILVVVKSVWKTVTLPFRILFFPFKMIGKFLKIVL
ncbi:hypothetical protein HZS55_12900 [Halosimplex rubrum]|uniref:Uncharacterized protein n=1 Tax=Halosimplex rubrum TaxID=869889 RepID=A0A7D5P0U8_9EURY|nr:hypothetical protein [Halosimplex rubrum]QLH78146.1 hypothetical protein HZS55_12900 [Halosimplex rubrum]